MQGVAQQQGPDLQQFKESAVKYLLSGQYNDLLKNEDTLKSIELSVDDAGQIKNIQTFLDRLEREDLQFHYCRLCECILPESGADGEGAAASLSVGGVTPLTSQPATVEQQIQPKKEEAETVTADPLQPLQPESATLPHSAASLSAVAADEPADALIQHIQTNKHHKKMREELGIKEIEDLCFSILYFGSTPGDISKELLKEKEKALRRKVKRLKVQLQQMAVSHDNAGSKHAWKDYSSLNKKTLQIKCLDLEKQVNPVIRDYEALEQNLKEV